MLTQATIRLNIGHVLRIPSQGIARRQGVTGGNGGATIANDFGIDQGETDVAAPSQRKCRRRSPDRGRAYHVGKGLGGGGTKRSGGGV
ncbi:MAG: hypothetical protein AMXMBFR64_51740 [Myxococcales bacterium]